MRDFNNLITKCPIKKSMNQWILEAIIDYLKNAEICSCGILLEKGKK